MCYWIRQILGAGFTTTEENTMPPRIEKRVANIQPQGSKLVGYAAVFGPLSEDLGGFRERVAPEAFNRSLEGDTDIRALVDHDTAKVLGRSSSGTLKLSTDERGLKVEIDLPDTTYANDLRALLERGDVSQMSFAFLVEPNGEKWEGRDEAGMRIRTLTDVQLIEVSVVTIPAYPDTVAALRSMGRLNHEAKQARDHWLATNRVAPRWGG
jgi:HK97 family phage prohead protease